MTRELSALVVGNGDCYVGTVFQDDNGAVKSLGSHQLDLPLEVRETRQFQTITQKQPTGKIKGKKVWLLSHYENSILTVMIRGTKD